MDKYASAPPNQILGYTVHSHTRIYVSYILPSVLATLLYIVQFVADCSVSYEYFHNNEMLFGGATLSLILIPPLLTFILVLSSKDQRAYNKSLGRFQYVGLNVLRLCLFPFYTLYRFALQIFWSIEALFQKDNDSERMLCLEKAAESHTCELYLFIQAYAQAAPQIILQMFYMLSQDLFRNYDIATAQGICLVFSAIDLAMITTSYQRFESQHQVGRACPWSTPDQIEEQRRILDCDSRLRNECACRKRESERSLNRFPQSDKIMENFNTRLLEDDNNNDNNNDDSLPKSHTVQVHSLDEVDNDDGEFLETTALVHKENNSSPTKAGPPTPNATDDDKIKGTPKLHIGSNINNNSERDDEITLIDTVPDTPPPPLPTLNRTQSQSTTQRSTAQNKRASKTVTQFETFKDMLIVNAQLYIKEHLPHPPKLLIQRVDNQEKETPNKSFSTPGSPDIPAPDEIDFFLPRPTRIVNGIQQEDIAAKTVAFFGWIAFIIMRMLALGTFCFFYPKAFFIIICVHYIVMLLALCLESRFKGTFNVALFYIVLAYVYIFVLLEFKVKFKKVRLWIAGYFILTMTENITMTAIWYSKEEFESWWFGFIAESITYGGILFVCTLIVYYFLLKPKDVTLIVEDNEAKKNP